MNRETFEEIAAMAAALVLAYWVINVTEFLWSVVIIVAKSAIANTLVP